MDHQDKRASKEVFTVEEARIKCLNHIQQAASHRTIFPQNGPPPHILKPSPAKAAAMLSKLDDDSHEPQSLADWNAASENVLNDANASAAAPPSQHHGPPAQAAPVSRSSPPQKRPIILEIVNGTDRRSKKAATSNSEPAYTAPFPHPTEPGKIVLRNPWDGDTVVLDREEEERAAREFFRAHVAETDANLHGSSRVLSGGDGQKVEEEEEKRASVAAELVPTLAGVESEKGGFAMGALFPPLVDFMTVSDSEGSASPGPPAGPPPQQQQQQAGNSQQKPSSQQQQQQQRTSFEAEMLAIFESVRSSVAPSNSATLAALASTSTQQQPLFRDKLPPPPSATPGGKVFTPAIPPPNRSPPKPTTQQQTSAAVQPPPRQQQQQLPQQPQRSAQNRPSMETARSSLDKIQLAALGLAADLDASEENSSAASATAGANTAAANPTATAARAPAAAAAVVSPKGVITPTVLSAKRVQVTPANRVGPSGGTGHAAGSPASAYTTTSGPASGGGEAPRMVREQSAGDGASQAPSGAENALPPPDAQQQKGVAS
ncbi:hypothetical protein HDU88_002025 [Geranomyces variabilis]|nr:hypothetical protein HDU88_002025 [Geranomyces variabilis]